MDQLFLDVVLLLISGSIEPSSRVEFDHLWRNAQQAEGQHSDRSLARRSGWT